MKIKYRYDSYVKNALFHMLLFYFIFTLFFFYLKKSDRHLSNKALSTFLEYILSRLSRFSTMMPS